MEMQIVRSGEGVDDVGPIARDGIGTGDYRTLAARFKHLIFSTDLPRRTRSIRSANGPCLVVACSVASSISTASPVPEDGKDYTFRSRSPTQVEERMEKRTWRKKTTHEPIRSTELTLDVFTNRTTSDERLGLKSGGRSISSYTPDNPSSRIRNRIPQPDVAYEPTLSHRYIVSYCVALYCIPLLHKSSPA